MVLPSHSIVEALLSPLLCSFFCSPSFILGGYIVDWLYIRTVTRVLYLVPISSPRLLWLPALYRIIVLVTYVSHPSLSHHCLGHFCLSSLIRLWVFRLPGCLLGKQFRCCILIARLFLNALLILFTLMFGIKLHLPRKEAILYYNMFIDNFFVRSLPPWLLMTVSSMPCHHAWPNFPLLFVSSMQILLMIVPLICCVDSLLSRTHLLSWCSCSEWCWWAQASSFSWGGSWIDDRRGSSASLLGWGCSYFHLSHQHSTFLCFAG